jgi:peptidoglycan/xylan/chitin deacetylase (PgdA/CDA1 family)
MAGYPGRAPSAIAGRVTPVFAADIQRHRETIYNRAMIGSFVFGSGVAVAAVAMGYQSKSPTGQWYGRTFTGLRRGSKQLALTYDDGPNDPHTLRLLEVLAKHNVKATFFLVGRFVKQRPDIARELVQAGHVVGNHTFSHPNLVFASALQTRMQLEDCDQVLTDAVGEHSRLFRPPFGGRRPSTLKIVRALGLEPVMWTVAGRDWIGMPAEYIERRVCGRIRGGDVILLHDGGHEALGADRSQTIIATDRLIAHYRSQGYEFVTIPQMMLEQAGSSSSSVPG